MSSTTEEIHQGLRARTIKNEIVPMLCGSAFKNKGVQMMLDAVVYYLPAPIDVPAVKGNLDDKDSTPTERHPTDDEPFSALAFKIMTDPFVGTLTFFRVYSGVLNSGDTLYNPIKSQKGAHRPPPADACQQPQGDQGSPRRRHRRGRGPERRDAPARRSSDPEKIIILEKMIFPEPVISVAVEPKTKADQEKMGIALQKLAQEDPSFRVHTDEESGQTIISGMGELHLEIIVDRMKREFKVEANVGKPQVAYRETIRASVESEGKFVRQSGGRGQYGHVWLKIEPQEAGQGLRVRERHRRRHRAEGIHPGRGQGHPGAAEERRPRGLSGSGRQGHPVRRFVPRRGLQRNGVQDRRLRWASRTAAARPSRCCSSRS